jgi:hypothetical protein
VFYLSHDDRFMVKTMRKEEMKILLDMLPKYYRHVTQHPHTLLTKFYGLHRMKPSKGRKVGVLEPPPILVGLGLATAYRPGNRRVWCGLGMVD